MAAALARSGTLERAAADLGITTAAFTQWLLEFEDAIGGRAFSRLVATKREGTDAVCYVQLEDIIYGKLNETVAVGETKYLLVPGFEGAIKRAVDPAYATRDPDRSPYYQAPIEGPMRIIVPGNLHNAFAREFLPEMRWRHPNLEIDLIFSNDTLDELEFRDEDRDACFSFQEPCDEGLIKIGITPPLEATLVAAHSYLKKEGEPRSLQDLMHRKCIGFKVVPERSGFTIRLDDPPVLTSPVNQWPGLRVQWLDNSTIVEHPVSAQMALNELGIAYIRRQPGGPTKNDRLQPILPEADITERCLYLYFRSVARDNGIFVSLAEDARDIFGAPILRERYVKSKDARIFIGRVMSLPFLDRPRSWEDAVSESNRRFPNEVAMSYTQPMSVPGAAMVRVITDALADGVPPQDIVIGNSHHIYLGDRPIPVSSLVNGATILGGVYAGGIPPDDSSLQISMDEPRVDQEELGDLDEQSLLPVREYLLQRARMIGYKLVHDPRIQVALDDGTTLETTCTNNIWKCCLPAGVEQLRILSRSSIGMWVWPSSNDPRRLGVAVRGLSIVKEDLMVPLSIEESPIDGFHYIEKTGDITFRWTDGAARIQIPSSSAGDVLEMELAFTCAYWDEPVSEG